MSFKEWEDRDRLVRDIERANELFLANDYTYKDISRILKISEHVVGYLIYPSYDEFVKQLDGGFKELPPRYIKYKKEFPGDTYGPAAQANGARRGRRKAESKK